jgi:hypothetical protein
MSNEQSQHGFRSTVSPVIAISVADEINRCTV